MLSERCYASPLREYIIFCKDFLTQEKLCNVKRGYHSLFLTSILFCSPLSSEYEVKENMEDVIPRLCIRVSEGSVD
jgi:hypothetical protein